MSLCRYKQTRTLNVHKNPALKKERKQTLHLHFYPTKKIIHIPVLFFMVLCINMCSYVVVDIFYDSIYYY